mmetsp:Transcript_45574/g.128666  ORF Transcript_45574/g.128666 Transcript_45574/m.128666 type:complete len:292 (-) Transcript_45574:356-1231(-)
MCMVTYLSIMPASTSCAPRPGIVVRLVQLLHASFCFYTAAVGAFGVLASKTRMQSTLTPDASNPTPAGGRTPLKAFYEKGASGCEKLRALAAEGVAAKWKDIGSTHGIERWVRRLAGEPLQTKGRVFFPAKDGLGPAQILDYIWDESTKKEYDPEYEQGFRVADYPEENQTAVKVLYQAYKTPGLGIPGRDFIILTARQDRQQDGGRSRATMSVQSVDWSEELTNTSKHHWRGKAMLCGFDCESLPDGGVQVTYIEQIDACGSIPEWLQRQVKIRHLDMLNTIKTNVVNKY